MSEERLHKGALDDRNILQALAVFRAELGEPTHVNQFPYIAATFILARLFGPNWIQSEVNGQSGTVLALRC